MPVFDYTASDASGARSTGALDAADELALDRELERRGLVLLSASAQRSGAQPEGHVNSAELAALLGQLATLLGAGVPLANGLDALAERQERAAARVWTLGIARDLRGGAALSDAFERRAQVVPREVRAAVRAGESSGALAEVLEGLARHLDAKTALGARARQALIHPSLLALALLGLVAVLLGFLLPRVTALYPRGAESLPRETRALLAVSNFLRDGAPWIALALAATVFAAWAWLRRPGSRAALGSIMCSIPRLGRLLRAVAAARFASTAAVLHAAGCDALTLLRVGGEASGNAAFEAAIQRASVRVTRGALFSEALGSEPLVDRLLVQVVAVGESSGALAPALSRAARRYEEDVPRELARFLALLEPLLLVVSALVVAWILLAALLPIFELYEHVS